MSKCRWELGPVELGDRGYDSIKISSTYTVFCCFTFDRFVHLIALHAVVCGHFISIRDHRLTRWVSECVLNNLRCNFSFFHMFVMTLIMAKEVESYNWKRTYTHRSFSYAGVIFTSGEPHDIIDERPSRITFDLDRVWSHHVWKVAEMRAVRWLCLHKTYIYIVFQMFTTVKRMKYAQTGE